jgi:hypothetical protein
VKYFRGGRGFDLEGELRAGRSKPRAEFVEALSDQVRGRPRERTQMGRAGLAVALSGLIMVAVVSFGSVGYASSSGSQDVSKQAAPSKSAAQAQYGPAQAPFTPPGTQGTTTTRTQGTTTTTQEPFTPPTTTPTAQGQAPEQTAPATQSQLPFTGLALWIPLAIGLSLIVVGMALRVKSRRRRSAAH